MRQDARQLDRQRERLQDRRQDLRQDLRQARRWDNVNDRRWYQSRWNNRARTFDARVYRRAFFSPRRYRAGVYYRPYGWSYRRWGVGAYFPRSYWTPNYFINSWFSFGLIAPPWGYEWVRYGPDAVLVDVRTGMILQVRYNVFY
ncbi:MAG TPA: RcnB family protein [Caulobacteraceae bacterium]